MSPEFNLALRIVWIAVIGYWLWSAHKVERPVQTEPFVIRLVAYWLPLILAVVLLGPGEWYHGLWLAEQFVPHSVLFESFGLVICIAGAAVACISRYVLGKNWSATVQLKEHHQLVVRGPYRWVRHPIYSGFLLLFLGNAVLVGDYRGLLAVTIVFVSFWRKWRLEEQWLTQHFGGRYREYVHRTHAVIPRLF